MSIADIRVGLRRAFQKEHTGPVRGHRQSEPAIRTVVNRSIVPVLSAACQYRFGTPPRNELKMIRRLSGVHTGD